MTPVAQHSDSDARWHAVTSRDPTAEDVFVYAVRTTGVYCRPTCPSRRPLRRNVLFFANPREAASAGYRPCRRCSPNGNSPRANQAKLIARTCRQLETADQPLRLAELARAAGLSPHHFQRLFKAHTGVTPKAYAAALRARRLQDSLTKDNSVTTAIYASGHTSSSRAYETSRATLGMTPSRYRAGGPQVDVRFAIGQCSLGAILVAATANGVCAIFLGDDPEPLVRELERRFPQAELLTGDDDSFAAWIANVIGVIERPAEALMLPLDIQGTALQRQVWEALRRIPPGETKTYSELARDIGRPRSTRAVAAACAANPLAVAIPCHRVIRTDGTLAGYRWGIDRKQELLRREHDQTKSTGPNPDG